MAVVSLPEILGPAFEHRYGVAAFNAVDDITMDGLIRAAEGRAFFLHPKGTQGVLIELLQADK